MFKQFGFTARNTVLSLWIMQMGLAGYALAAKTSLNSPANKRHQQTSGANKPLTRHNKQNTSVQRINRPAITSSSPSFSAAAARSKSVNTMAYYKKAETLSQAASLSTSQQLADEKIVSGSASLVHTQSLVDRNDGTKQVSRTVLANIVTKINSQWNVLTRIAFDQNLRDSESVEDGFSDLTFRLGKTPVELSDWVTGSPSYSLVLPTSEYSSKYQNSQASLGAAYTFALTPAVLAKGFDLSLLFGVSRNFHKYETDVNHKILNPYGMREALSGSYSYRDWTFSLDLILRHAWNYEGSVSQSFEHSQEVGYSLLKGWDVSLGHTNSGAWLKPNGQDSNLKLINEDDSLFYLSTSVKF